MALRNYHAGEKFGTVGRRHTATGYRGRFERVWDNDEWVYIPVMRPEVPLVLRDVLVDIKELEEDRTDDRAEPWVWTEVEQRGRAEELRRGP